MICHKADLRFVSISGQKVLDSVQGALEQGGGSDASLESTKQLVTDNLQDANHRYTTLHTKVKEVLIIIRNCAKRHIWFLYMLKNLCVLCAVNRVGQPFVQPVGEIPAVPG